MNFLKESKACLEYNFLINNAFLFILFMKLNLLKQKLRLNVYNFKINKALLFIL